MADRVVLNGMNLIGSSESREGAPSFHGIDPTDGSALEPGYADATATEIDRALILAVEAQRALRRVTAEQRAMFLEACAYEILELGDPLLERAAAETGLPPARLTGERGRTVGQLRMFAQVVREGRWLDRCIESAEPDREPLPKPELRRILRPIGPVVVFGASNFPLAFSVAGGDTASALAAGCPVIVKAHPNHPGTGELVGRAIRAAVAKTDMPEGALSLLHGAEPVVGQLLVVHALTRAVAFTGSHRGGRALYELAASRPHPIPVYAEMGSVNPVFLLPGVFAGDNADRIAAAAQQSVSLGVGQFCTNPGLLIAMDDDDTERFLKKLGELLDAVEPGTMLHAGISRNYLESLAGLQACADVRTLLQPPPVAEGACQVKPALLAVDGAVFLAEPHLASECFGPSTLVVLCASLAEMQQVAESLAGQLTVTIHAGSAGDPGLPSFIEILEEKAGRLLYGGFPTGVEVCEAMQHGGPYPATTDSRTTSVGAAAITRFARPVCYQSFPAELLPQELR